MSEAYKYNGFLYCNGYSAGTALVLSDSKARADVVYFAFFKKRTYPSLGVKAEAAAAAKYVPTDLAEVYAAVDYALPDYLGRCLIESPVPLEPLVGTDLEADASVYDRPVRTVLDDVSRPDYMLIIDRAGDERWVTRDEYNAMNEREPVRECKGWVLSCRDESFNIHGSSRLWYTSDGMYPPKDGKEWHHPDWSTDGYSFILLATTSHASAQPAEIDVNRWITVAEDEVDDVDGALNALGACQTAEGIEIHGLANLDAAGVAECLRDLAARLRVVATNLIHLADNADLADLAASLEVAADPPDTVRASVVDAMAVGESSVGAITPEVDNRTVDELLGLIDNPAEGSS